MSDPIKPCPCCGPNVLAAFAPKLLHDMSVCWVECPCGMRTGDYGGIDLAIKAWNTRKTESNTPIENLLAEYKAEDSDFSDINNVVRQSLRYAQTMPDDHVRCLLYTLAMHVSNDNHPTQTESKARDREQL